jgi:hypothetical protein
MMKNIEDLPMSDFSVPLDSVLFNNWKKEYIKKYEYLKYFYSYLVILIGIFCRYFFVGKIPAIFFLLLYFLLLFPPIFIVNHIKVKNIQKRLGLSNEDINKARKKEY